MPTMADDAQGGSTISHNRNSTIQSSTSNQLNTTIPSPTSLRTTRAPSGMRKKTKTEKVAALPGAAAVSSSSVYYRGLGKTKRKGGTVISWSRGNAAPPGLNGATDTPTSTAAVTATGIRTGLRRSTGDLEAKRAALNSSGYNGTHEPSPDSPTIPINRRQQPPERNLHPSTQREPPLFSHRDHEIQIIDEMEKGNPDTPPLEYPLADDNHSLQEIDVDSYQIAAQPSRDPFNRIAALNSQPNLPTGYNISNTSLALPRAVVVASDDALMQAEVVDQAELECKRAAEQTKRKNFLRIEFLIIVLVLAFVFAIAFVLSSKNTKQIATLSPSVLPSESSSSAPSSALDKLLQYLPNSTLESLKIYSTPQWNARDWLLGHPELPAMPEWRKEQLFALATFYYAMEGPDWPKYIRDRWLQYSDECLWFSNLDGEFSAGYWQETKLDSTIYPPCNEQGKFQSIVLSGLALSNFHPVVPPEIVLLTSLAYLALFDNNITATIDRVLPAEMCSLRDFSSLDLHRNSLTGNIGTELSCMSSLKELDLQDNALSGHIPSSLGLLTSMTFLSLGGNRLTGRIPSQFGILTGMSDIDLTENRLTGIIPSELDRMTNLQYLALYYNELTGPIPSQIGAMTNLQLLRLYFNNLTGQIPSQVGLMTSMTYLMLFANNLSGEIPTQVGMMSKISWLALLGNQLSGLVPSEIGLLVHMSALSLDNNILTGTIPTEIAQLAVNGSLVGAGFSNNNFSGTIPDELCSFGPYNRGENLESGLIFDCNNQLCGCCWCPCWGSNTSLDSIDCPTEGVVSTKIFEDWPGLFPPSLNSTNIIVINLFTDEYPEETALGWSIRDESGFWEHLQSHVPQENRTLHSYTMQVESNATYRLQIFDKFGDGTCCGEFGFGWFTVTNSTPSHDHADGTLLWGVFGFFEVLLEVFFWIDEDGHSYHVAYVPGKGYALLPAAGFFDDVEYIPGEGTALVPDESALQELIIVVPEIAKVTNSSMV